MKYIKKGAEKIVSVWQSPQKRRLPSVISSYIWALGKVSSRVPLPSEIQLEVSSFCNLHCGMCTLKDRNYLKLYFSVEKLFDRLLDQLPGLMSINFTGIGESLLHKDLELFVQKAKSRNIKTAVVTNAMLLTKERLDSLIRSKIDSVAISIETANPKKYEEIRRGASFARLLDNLEHIAKAKNKTATKFSFNVCLFRDTIQNIHEIMMIIDLAHKYQIREISFQNTHDAILNIRDVIESGSFRKKIKMISEYAARFNITCSFPSGEIKKDSCYYPWIYPYITSSGEMLPCCVIPQFGDYAEIISQFSFGNIFENPVREVWNSERAVNFRRKLSKRKPISHCSNCSKYWNIL